MLLMAMWRRLMLPGAKNGDLLRFKCLFTTKLISLTVLSGKAQ